MKIEEIKSIGILGAGVMGTGIAQTATLAGYDTIVRDLDDDILKKARDTIINGRFGMKGAIERGKLTQEKMDEALAQLTMTTNVADLKDCDIVIEVIGGAAAGELENKPLKLKVFAELDKIIKKEAIFATNTGLFTVTDLAAVTQRRDKFIGMHWFSPAFIMKAVEVVWTADTSEETIQTIEGLCQRFGKISARVKDMPGDRGHAGLRIHLAAVREAEAIVKEGVATPEDIDAIMTGGFGWPSGPLAMLRGVQDGWK